MKTTYTFYETIILDSVNFDACDLEEPKTDKEKIDRLFDIFSAEYINPSNQYKGTVTLMKDWLQGLPSVVSVSFYYNDIIDEAKRQGFNYSDEEDFLNNYFGRLASAFYNLVTSN